MARKGMLANITGDKLTPVNRHDDAAAPIRQPSSAFSSRGAFGAVTRTIDDLAAKADAAREIEAQLTAGETIIDLDPLVVDDSFMSDRLSQDDEAFRDLVEAIRERGQDSPILVRQHPQSVGRYQVAFGHRRLRAARALGRHVRAVVKKLSDRDLVIAQGQENSARANLTFVERAVFAHRLEENGYGRDLIMTALSTDKVTVSRIISVARSIPIQVIEKIGPAPAAGRGRWFDLAAAFDNPETLKLAKLIMASPGFDAGTSDERFETMHSQLTTSVPNGKAGASTQAPRRATASKFWAATTGERIARIHANHRAFTFAIDNNAAPGFGDFLLSRMDRLFDEYSDDRRKAEKCV